MKTLLYSLAIVLAFDAMGFAAWAVSGQQPVDGFYIGAITKNLINLFI